MRQAAALAPKTEVSTLADWVSLLKPRVISLVVFTGLIGLLLAPGHLDAFSSAIAVLCIAAGAGAAGAMNMWYDHDIDAVMRRTARRPVPAGRIAPAHALAYGLGLAIASVALMAIALNLAAAFALAGSIAFYVVIYTMWLKRRTAQNIVWGGAAGALPPVIGWLAVTGSLDVLPCVLFAIVFLWTPPHFWSLSLVSHADYRRAGLPMLPVVAGLQATRRQVFAYSVVVVLASLLPWGLHVAGAVYGLAAAVLGVGFLTGAWRVLRDGQPGSGASRTGDAPAMGLFKYSILYLFALFTALAVDHLVI